MTTYPTTPLPLGIKLYLIGVWAVSLALLAYIYAAALI